MHICGYSKEQSSLNSAKILPQGTCTRTLCWGNQPANSVPQICLSFVPINGITVFVVPQCCCWLIYMILTISPGLVPIILSELILTILDSIPMYESSVYTHLFAFFLLYECRAINGVKDMIGFRETFNLLEGGNRSKSMYDDDVGSSPHRMNQLILTILFALIPY